MKTLTNDLTTGGIITKYNQLLNDICANLQGLLDDLKDEISGEIDEMMEKEPYPWILFNQVKTKTILLSINQ